MTGSERPLARRRIGLLGGSFDPVHVAHVALAKQALAQLSLDEVRWLPAGQPWQKERAVSAAAHRVNMVRLATAPEARFVVDTLEVDRPGPTYTVDTLHALQSTASEADCFLILGQDQYANLHTWHRWQDIVACVTLAVAARAGQVPLPAGALACHPHRMVVLDLPPMQVSSTAIRQRLAAGESPFSLAPGTVPEAVAGYIAQHQLYAAGNLR